MAGQHTLRGMSHARAVFRQIAPVFRRRVDAAGQVTGKQVVAGARARVPVRLGFLRDRIAMQTRRGGRVRVGIQVGLANTGGGRVVDPGRYGYLQEVGTAHHAAQPFMRPSAEGERGPHVRRLRKAGKDAERELAGHG